MGARIVAMGGYVPPTKITNEHIEAWTGKGPEWVLERTGIHERRYAAEETPTSEIAYRAVVDLRTRFRGALADVTQLIFATSTPDRPQPPTAMTLQHMTGLPPQVAACDVNAVCAGWLYGLRFAAALADTQPGNVLLVAADKYSPIMDRRDPTTVTLFGDGAGAVVIAPNADPDSGLRSLLIKNHGEFADMVTVRAGGTECPHSEKATDYLFRMEGRMVKEYVLTNLPAMVYDACDQAEVGLSDIGALVCHQANPRLLQTLAATLEIDESRVPLTAPYYGNSGCASLPLALLKAHDSGLLVPGRPVVLCAVGGGMSVAAGVYVP